MTKILFLIHDLSVGGAEKVLVNLVNNMDQTQFDITVMAIFGGGVNEQFLSPSVQLINCFPYKVPGNSHFMKLLSPEKLHDLLIKEHYDIEVAYLEGVAARIVSGCRDKKTKTACWIHCTMKSEDELAIGFRNFKEATSCYKKFDSMVFVSKGVQDAFLTYCPNLVRTEVLYNTNESEKIKCLAKEPIANEIEEASEILKVIGMGKVVANKGFDRLARIHKRLRDDGYLVHFYILGIGNDQKKIQNFLDINGLSKSFTFLGYQTNPYKYISKCDLFVCSSYAEGFSTAATEALIVGTPVCTVEVSGMKEMLGEHNEYGMVTDNDEDALYQGIKTLLDNPAKLYDYKQKALERGKKFSTKETVCAAEQMLLTL